jgi:hypothetical protein
MTELIDDDLDKYEEIAPGQFAKRGPDGQFEDVQLSSERAREIRSQGQQKQDSLDQIRITKILQSRGLDVDDEFLRSLAEALAKKRSNAVQAAVYLDRIAGLAPTNESQSQPFEVISPGELVKIGSEYYSNTHLLNAEQAKGLLNIISVAKGEKPRFP